MTKQEMLDWLNALLIKYNGQSNRHEDKAYVLEIERAIEHVKTM